MYLYRARPTFVQAFLYTGKSINELAAFFERNGRMTITDLGDPDDAWVNFTYGETEVTLWPGHYVVIDETKTLSLISVQRFRSLYQRATFEEEDGYLQKLTADVLRDLRS